MFGKYPSRYPISNKNLKLKKSLTFCLPFKFLLDKGNLNGCNYWSTKKFALPLFGKLFNKNKSSTYRAKIYKCNN